MAASGDGTVGKALAVLDQVAAFGRPVRFTEILDASPYPKPTLYRLLQTLTNQKMLEYDDDRQTYAPGLRLVRLAHAAWSQSSLTRIARPHLRRLSDETGETVHLATLDHAQVLYIDKCNARQPVEMFSQAGKVGPAYCTGVGKVMLAHVPPEAADALIAQQSFHAFTARTLADDQALRKELRDIRRLGYGFDREEHEPGIICVAAPILSTSARLIGAVSVTSTTNRTNLAGLERQVPRLRQTAQDIAGDVQSWSFPDQQNPELNEGGDQWQKSR